MRELLSQLAGGALFGGLMLLGDVGPWVAVGGTLVGVILGDLVVRDA